MTRVQSRFWLSRWGEAWNSTFPVSYLEMHMPLFCEPQFWCKEFRERRATLSHNAGWWLEQEREWKGVRLAELSEAGWNEQVGSAVQGSLTFATVPLFPMVVIGPLRHRCVCLCIVSTCRHLMLQCLLTASVLRKSCCRLLVRRPQETGTVQRLNPVCLLHTLELRWTLELRQDILDNILEKIWVQYWLSMTSAFL